MRHRVRLGQTLGCWKLVEQVTSDGRAWRAQDARGHEVRILMVEGHDNDHMAAAASICHPAHPVPIYWDHCPSRSWCIPSLVATSHVQETSMVILPARDRHLGRPGRCDRRGPRRRYRASPHLPCTHPARPRRTLGRRAVRLGMVALQGTDAAWLPPRRSQVEPWVHQPTSSHSATGWCS